VIDKPSESRRLVQADGCFHVYTHPRVAYLICRIRRVASLRARALLEVERVAYFEAAELGWYRVEYSPPLYFVWGGIFFALN
jgi:hypothetical protein